MLGAGTFTSLPSNLSGMLALRSLVFSQNVVNGSIPPRVGLHLTHLDLSGNGLSGTLPSSLGSLTALAYKDLSSNALSGSPPAQLGSLTALTTMRLSANVLSGPVPASWSSLTALSYLQLLHSGLCGHVASSHQPDDGALPACAPSPPGPLPPRPPRPIASWSRADQGEAIAVDIAFSSYAPAQSFYAAAFTSAFDAFNGYVSPSTSVSGFYQSSAGTTQIYFTVIISTTSDSSAGVQHVASSVLALFNTSHPACSSTKPRGCPAYANFTAALRANGMPAAGAYYNDQNTPSQFVASTAPVNASQIGTWQREDRLCAQHRPGPPMDG